MLYTNPTNLTFPEDSFGLGSSPSPSFAYLLTQKNNHGPLFALPSRRTLPYPAGPSTTGMVFLLPIYEQGIHDNQGASRLSMANLEERGETLWCGVVFAYIFTFYFLYSLRREFLA